MMSTNETPGDEKDRKEKENKRREKEDKLRKKWVEIENAARKNEGEIPVSPAGLGPGQISATITWVLLQVWKYWNE